MFYKRRKSVLSTLVLAQLWLSTSVHAPNVTVLLFSGESIFERELQGNTSIAELTDLVKEQFQFPGELLASKPGITVNPTTRLGEIATDGHVSLIFVKHNRVEHILSGRYTIGVRAVRNNDGQEQYTLVLKGSDLCHEIDITSSHNWLRTILKIKILNSNLREDCEISPPIFTENARILQTLLSGGINTNTMELVQSFSDFTDNNDYLARSHKSAYEMAIKEIHGLEFVISQVAQKDPAEVRPLQESINWIKHELDSRNTNNDLVNAIWFTYKRTQVFKDIYNLVDKHESTFIGSAVDISTVVSYLCERHRLLLADSEPYDRMRDSVSNFYSRQADQYYIELPGNLWQVYWGGNQQAIEYEIRRYQVYMFNKLSVLVRELSRLRF